MHRSFLPLAGALGLSFVMALAADTPKTEYGTWGVEIGRAHV